LGPTASNSTRRSVSRQNRPSLRTLVLAASAGVACLLGGCSTDLDNFLHPSQVGRHEMTPTSVPILDRIAAIEGPADQYVEHDTIRTEDLRPEASEYRVTAGDTLEVRIWDIIQPGVVEIYPLLVDTRGMVTIPQLGEIVIAGLSVEQTRESIANATSSLVKDPLVQVTVAQSRKQTFTILGAVGGPGTYFIPAADYRILEAITAAGGVAETIPNILVIRQIPLEAQPTNTGATGGDGQGGDEPQGEQFIDLLDSLTGDDSGSPAVLAGGNSWQPEQPAIGLIEGDAPAGSNAGQPQVASAWIFVNGEWVRTTRADGVAGAGIQPGAIVTQRVIKVPIKQLLAGDARYNIVVRPGDVLRVPPADQGFIYIGGEVNRPGSYTLPVTGPYTLRRAIVSAGDLSPTGIPERCDLTRMVGETRQATIMLNYRAIVEGTQPDVVLKPNDIITVGTTFWAYPLAVFRNGFRATYGFGFLLDRNFGNDVFGAPPTNFSDR
jgi:polysaccharide export outer membrane protein